MAKVSSGVGDRGQALMKAGLLHQRQSQLYLRDRRQNELAHDCVGSQNQRRWP